MTLVVAGVTTRVSANAVSAVSGTFSPPAGSILVAIANANSNTTGTVTCAISNSVSARTWTQQVFANFSSGQPGGVFIFTAPCPSAITNTAVTATTTNNNSTVSDRYTSIKVWWITGNSTGTFIGASNKGSSTTNNLTTPSFTNQGANSLGFAGATDWTAPSGAPTSSDLTGDGFTNSAVLDGFSGYKALGAAGAASTFNFDAAGTSAVQWNWASLEILDVPATGPTTKGQHFPFLAYHDDELEDRGGLYIPRKRIFVPGRRRSDDRVLVEA